MECFFTQRIPAPPPPQLTLIPLRAMSTEWIKDSQGDKETRCSRPSNIKNFSSEAQTPEIRKYKLQSCCYSEQCTDSQQKSRMKQLIDRSPAPETQASIERRPEGHLIASLRDGLRKWRVPYLCETKGDILNRKLVRSGSSRIKTVSKRRKTK